MAASASNVVLLKAAEENVKRLAEEAQRFGKPLQAKQSPTVNQLVTACGGKVLAVAGVTCRVLSVAAQEKWVEPHSLIEQLLVCIPSASHPHSIVSLVCELLRIDSVTTTTQWTTHPLISVLLSRPDLTTTCSQCIVELLSNHEDSFCVFELFFKYLLIHPDPIVALSGDVLFSELLLLADQCPSLSQPLVRLMLRMTPLLQCSNGGQVGRVERRVCQLTHFVLHHQAQVPVELLDYLLAVCVECVRYGTVTHRPLRCLQQFIAASKLTINTHHVMALAWLLTELLLDPTAISIILTIVTGAIESGAISSHGLLLFTLPLVSLLSQPAPVTLTPSPAATVRRTAAHILTHHLPTHTDHTHHQQLAERDDTTVPLSPSPSQQYTLLSATAACYIECSPQTVCCALREQLQAPVAAAKSSSGVVHIALVVCALCTSTSQSPIDMLPTIAKLDPTLAPSLLSFCVHSLSKADQLPAHQLSLLYALPSLAVDTVSAELVAAIVSTLSPSLYPIAVRLMCKACQKQDCLFEKLCSLFSHSPSSSHTEEWSIAVAASIADICTTHSTQHGEDMLKYISSLLSQPNPHPVVLAMLTTAITTLCQNDICDVAVLWQLLSNKLQSGVSVAGDKALCSLYSLAAPLLGERGAEKKFKSFSLTQLWKFTTHKDVGVASLAMTSLSQFPVECHTPRFLPPALLGLLAAEGELDSEQPLTGEQLVMAAIGSSASAVEIASLLVAVINSEMPAPRGLVHTAVQKARASSAVDRKMAAASKHLRQAVGGAKTGISALVGVVSELCVAMSHPDVSVGQLQHVWETVLVSWEGASCDGELGWSCLAGFSFVSTVIEFSTALLSGEMQGGEADGVCMKDEAVQRARQSMIKRLQSMCAGGGRSVSGAGVLLSLVGMVCVGGASLSLSLVLAVLEVMLAVVRGQWPPAWSSHCLQLAALLKVIQATSFSDLLAVVLLTLPFLTITLTTHQMLSPCLSSLTQLLEAVQLRAKSCGVAAVVFSTTLLHLLPFEPKFLQSFDISPQATTLSDSLTMLVWALQHRNQEEGVGCEELLSSVCSLMTSSTKDIELGCLSLALSLPVMLLSRAISSPTAMGVVQLLADIASARVDLPVVHWSLGAALYGMCSVGEGVSDAMVDSVALRWVEQAMVTEQPAHTVLSAMLGIAGLIGVCPVPVKLAGLVPVAMLDRLLPDIVPFLTQCSNLSDPLLRSTALWLLAVVSRQHSVNNNSTERVPIDMGYLGAGSGLGTIFNLLQSRLADDSLAGVLKALVAMDGPLPPADWSRVVLPHLKNNYLQDCVVTLVTRHTQSLGWSHIALFCCQPHTFLCLSTASQAILLKNLSSLLTAQHCRHLLLAAAHCSVRLLSISSSHQHLVCCVAACTRDHSDQFAAEVLLEAMTELAHSSPPAAVLLPSQSLVSDLAECCAVIPDLCSDGSLHVPLTCRLIASGRVGIAAMQGVLTEVLCDGYDELSLIWLSSTVRELSSKSQHQLVLLSYLINWMKSCEQVADSILRNFMRILDQIFTVYSPLTVSSLPHWSLVCAASRLPATVVAKLVPATVQWLSTATDKSFRDLVLSMLGAMKQSETFTAHSVWTSVFNVV